MHISCFIFNSYSFIKIILQDIFRALFVRQKANITSLEINPNDDKLSSFQSIPLYFEELKKLENIVLNKHKDVYHMRKYIECQQSLRATNIVIESNATNIPLSANVAVKKAMHTNVADMVAEVLEKKIIAVEKQNTEPEEKESENKQIINKEEKIEAQTTKKEEESNEMLNDKKLSVTEKFFFCWHSYVQKRIELRKKMIVELFFT